MFFFLFHIYNYYCIKRDQVKANFSTVTLKGTL